MKNHLSSLPSVPKGLLVLGLLMVLALAPSIHAEEVFDYVKNPGNNYINGFSGLTNARIDTTTTAKTGYFFMQTSIQDTMCATQNVSFLGVTVIPNMNVKGYQSCYNVSPKVTVKIRVDNPDYGLTQFAKIGDYDTSTNHITVIPYSFNVWQGINSPSNNDINMNILFIQQDRNPSLKNIDPNKLGDIGNWVLDESTFFPYYEWKIKNKDGVCNSEVLQALASPSTYYTNPSRLTISGFGALTANNCRTLMFPSSSSIDRVNSMVDDYPYVFHSLYYDEDLSYLSYPFIVKDMQINCYKNGTRIASDYLDNGFKNGKNACTDPYACFAFSSFYDRYNSQPYVWTQLSDGSKINSPANIELMQRDFTFTCPAGTTYYTASVVIAKNYMYRHKSPLDTTWNWNNVFNRTSGSSFDTMFSSFPDSEALFLTQTGVINVPPASLPVNNTVSLSGNVDQNKINESNSTKYQTGTNSSYGSVPANGNSGTPPCVDCQQNISGYGTSMNGTSGGSGVQGGGSIIGSSIDDSAVTGLLEQSKGENRIQQKATFMQKLVMIGTALLVAIIIAYAVFALFGILYLFIVLLSIPQKMKETIRKIFDAGAGK